MAASGWGSAGGWDNDSDDGGTMEFARASVESNGSTASHAHDASVSSSCYTWGGQVSRAHPFQ